jgi:hypothetical protein
VKRKRGTGAGAGGEASNGGCEHVAGELEAEEGSQWEGKVNRRRQGECQEPCS